jgi:ketosteroid isomerase-like protein
MEGSMPTPRELTDAITTAYNAHQLFRLAEFFRPDIVLVVPDAGELKGRQQVAEYHRAFLQAFPDAKIEVEAKHDSGDTTIDEWTFHGTHTGPLSLPSGETIPPTGKHVSVRGVDVVSYAGGAVASHHAYFDQLQFLTALGLMPVALG